MTQVMHNIVSNKLRMLVQLVYLQVPDNGEVVEFGFYDTSYLHSDAHCPSDVALSAGYPYNPKKNHDHSRKRSGRCDCS